MHKRMYREETDMKKKIKERSMRSESDTMHLVLKY